MSELCDPTDAELRALCASTTGPSHLESLLPLANYRDIVALRRKLHEFPELANREHGTAATIREELTAIDGVELLGFAAGGTGVLALIEGATTEGRTILFRADMDGLPIAEKADARATALADPTQAPSRGWALLPVVSGQEHRVAPDELSSIEARPQERMA